jgi:hypothetical protein
LRYLPFFGNFLLDNAAAICYNIAKFEVWGGHDRAIRFECHRRAALKMSEANYPSVRNPTIPRGFPAAAAGADKLKKKKKSPVTELLKRLSAVAFVVWCVSSIVSTRSEISGRRSELEALRERAVLLELENEEFRNILYETDERAFMERIAIDVLGYAYPNERRFIDKTRS